MQTNAISENHQSPPAARHHAGTLAALPTLRPQAGAIACRRAIPYGQDHDCPAGDLASVR